MSVFNPITSEYECQVLSQVGEKLCMKTDMADVHFIFKSDDGSCERIPAHKFILISASDVFRTMFNGTWKEKDEVDISDVSADVFKEFLQFFYLRRVKLTKENVAKVMNLGKMYEVTECVAVCDKFVKNILNEDNVLQHYALALLLDQEELKKACETFIGVNIKEVFKSTDFLTCDKKMLSHILKLNWLSCTEEELFEACMNWVKTSSNEIVLSKELVLARLGDLFYDIRFGSMSFQEFGTLIPTYGQLFVGGDYDSIIQMITDKEFQAIKFNGNRQKRCDSNPWSEKDEIFCGRSLSKFPSSVPYFIKQLEITKFSVDQPLLLRRFTINFIETHRQNNYEDCENLSSDITIVEVSGSGESKKEVVKYNGKTTLTSSDSVNYELPKFIHVKPGYLYEIRLKQSPQKNCALGHLVNTEVKMNGITIKFHDDPLIPGDRASTGLIYKLYFYPIWK